MKAFHRLLFALAAPMVLLMTAGMARAQSSLWDSLIWDQDVWYVPEPEPASMALAGAALLVLLQRARRSTTRVDPRLPGG